MTLETHSRIGEIHPNSIIDHLDKRLTGILDYHLDTACFCVY